MTCPADLHTHTTASDGQYTPSQLAARPWRPEFRFWQSPITTPWTARRRPSGRDKPAD